VEYYPECSRQPSAGPHRCDQGDSCTRGTPLLGAVLTTTLSKCKWHEFASITRREIAAVSERNPTIRRPRDSAGPQSGVAGVLGRDPQQPNKCATWWNRSRDGTSRSRWGNLREPGGLCGGHLAGALNFPSGDPATRRMRRFRRIPRYVSLSNRSISRRGPVKLAGRAASNSARPSRGRPAGPGRRRSILT